MEKTIRIIKTSFSENGAILVECEEVFSENGLEIFCKPITYGAGLDEDVTEFPQSVQDKIASARQAFSAI